jgi:hypothetical protein
VVGGRAAHLRPLPAEERDGVGVGGIAGDGVALADRVHRPRQCLGVMPSAWSLIDQKSSAEQWRESQASAGGCAPSLPIGGMLNDMKVSSEKRGGTWRSPNRIFASASRRRSASRPRCAFSSVWRSASGRSADFGFPALRGRRN